MGDVYSLEVSVIPACELNYSPSLYRGVWAGTLQNCKLQIANCLRFFFTWPKTAKVMTMQLDPNKVC